MNEYSEISKIIQEQNIFLHQIEYLLQLTTLAKRMTRNTFSIIA